MIVVSRVRSFIVNKNPYGLNFIVNFLKYLLYISKLSGIGNGDEAYIAFSIALSKYTLPLVSVRTISIIYPVEDILKSIVYV